MQSILQRVDIRQLSGICLYSSKRTAAAVNQGGTADSLFVLDRVFLSRTFFVLNNIGGKNDFTYKTMAHVRVNATAKNATNFR